MQPFLLGKVLTGVFGKLVLVFLLALLFSACGGSVDFTANPDTVDEGTPSTLAWKVTPANGATDVTVDIQPNVGPVLVEGTRDVTPVETTEYTLTTTSIISGKLESETEVVTITVIPAPAPPVID
ncbi:MAG: hypothetical protein COA99_07960, partial [Moraxellaceae bacterium]